MEFTELCQKHWYGDLAFVSCIFSRFWNRCVVPGHPMELSPPSGLSLHLLYSRQLHSESAVAFSVTDSWLLHQHRGGWVALLCLLSSHFFQDCAAQSRPLTILCRDSFSNRDRWWVVQPWIQSKGESARRVLTRLWWYSFGPHHCCFSQLESALLDSSKRCSMFVNKAIDALQRSLCYAIRHSLRTCFCRYIS